MKESSVQGLSSLQKAQALSLVAVPSHVDSSGGRQVCKSQKDGECGQDIKEEKGRKEHQQSL